MFNSDVSSSGQPAVLLIDDDLVSRQVLATVLATGEYSIESASDGASALELLRESEPAPDVILVDAQMPGLSGAELIADLRVVCKAGIFVMSASQPPDEITAAADGFLMKPFGVAELTGLLREWRNHNSPEAALAAAEKLPAVYHKTLAQLRSMMPETRVRRIYEAVLVDLSARTAALEAAMSRRDHAEVRRIGHAIKGGCALAGVVGAARLGELLESGLLDSGSNQLDNKARLLADLRGAAGRLERMLEAEITV